MKFQNCVKNLISPGQLLPANHRAWSPTDPDTIHVPVGYEPNWGDLAFSNIPAQEMFDYSKPKYSKSELKPQSTIRIAPKAFILGH